MSQVMDDVKAACTRGLVLAPVAALLLSVAILLLGNGLLGTLLIVRAGQEGFSATAISAMMSFYFAGFTIGALALPRIIVSVGHVRTFAGFAAIASMTALLHVAFVDSVAWMPLRLMTGFAYAGMILATESWLNAHAVQSADSTDDGHRFHASGSLADPHMESGLPFRVKWIQPGCTPAHAFTR